MFSLLRLLATQREMAMLNEEKTDLEETLASVQARVYVNSVGQVPSIDQLSHYT